MELETSCRLVSGMAFEAEINGHRLMMDADSGAGGNDLGPRPKPLLLMSLAGCTGMDVIHILHKMRIEPRYFNIITRAQVQDDPPAKIKSIHLTYEVSGEVPMENMEKAVKQSIEKYCGVYATLAPSVKITHDIQYKD
jgi:putative redox protein